MAGAKKRIHRLSTRSVDKSVHGGPAGGARCRSDKRCRHLGEKSANAVICFINQQVDCETLLSRRLLSRGEERVNDGGVTAVHNRFWRQAAPRFAEHAFAAEVKREFSRRSAAPGRSASMQARRRGAASARCAALVMMAGMPNAPSMSPPLSAAAPVSRLAAPAALAAFLRGVERRGAVLAELQAGDAAAGDAALAAAMAGFRAAAADLPMADWPRAFWTRLLAQPAAAAPDRGGDAAGCHRQPGRTRQRPARGAAAAAGRRPRRGRGRAACSASPSPPTGWRCSARLPQPRRTAAPTRRPGSACASRSTAGSRRCRRSACCG